MTILLGETGNRGLKKKENLLNHLRDRSAASVLPLHMKSETKRGRLFVTGKAVRNMEFGGTVS